MRVMPKSLRGRLTLHYVAMLAGMLVISWAAIEGLLFFQLRNQLGHFSIEEIETVEGLLYFSPEGKLGLKDDYHNHPESKDVIERFVEIRDSNGNVIFRNDRLARRALGGPPFKGEGVGGYSERSDRLSDGTRVRLVSRVHSLGRKVLLVRLAHSEEPLYSRIKALLVSSLAVLPFMLGIAWVAGYCLARRALRPIDRMARLAEKITADCLHERLPVDDSEDEVAHLARVFNNTLARLEYAFQQLRRFTSDASHELRTPLAMIRSVGRLACKSQLRPPSTGTSSEACSKK